MHRARRIGCAAAAIAASVMTVPATSSEPVPFPHGYRAWRHVKSIVIGPEHRTFAIRGGIHHYYANEKAVDGYRTGTFRNGSVIVDEAVWTKDGEGPAKGIVLEGDRRGLDVMVKNDRRYKDTGGWGFEHFDGTALTGRLTDDGRTQCFQCHAKSARDHVYSSIRR